MLLWNTFLAIVWSLAVGELSLPNVAVGFALGYAALWLGRDVFGTAEYCERVPRVVEFTCFFLWKLIQANLRVAYDVVTPKHRMRPAIIAVPLDARSDSEIMLLASLITLTPGSLSLDVSSDRSLLFVHVLYVNDVEAEKQAIKNGFEQRLLKVLR